MGQGFEQEILHDSRVYELLKMGGKTFSLLHGIYGSTACYSRAFGSFWISEKGIYTARYVLQLTPCQS